MRRFLILLFVLVGGAVIVTALTLSQLRDPSADFALVLEGIRKPQVLDRHGEPLNVTYQNDWNVHDRVPLHAVPSFLRTALVVAEDRRFFHHAGDDWLARAHAAVQNLLALRAVRGASTITEQVVRMLHPRPRRLWSRWLEGWEARRLERSVYKTAILEFYLNQVPYAANRRGVAQAARYWFDRDLETLSRAEMLALAVLVRAPSRLNPFRDPDAVRPGLTRLANRLREQGLLVRSERDALLAHPLLLSRGRNEAQADHFLRYVMAHNPTGDRVRTTLDGVLQHVAQGLLDARLRALTAARVRNGAVLVADHASGEILVWAIAGANREDTPARFLDAVTARRQPGSTLKPFLYALALERGWTTSTLIDDSPLTESVGVGLHRYHNYSRAFHGPVTLRTALGNSLNIPALRTVQFVGAEIYQRRLNTLGFTGLESHPDFYGDGLALGNGEVSLLELVQAYATLANRGVMRPLKVLLEQPTEIQSRRVYSEEVASLIGNVLSDPQARGLEFGAHSVLNLPVQTAVKTGTSSDYRDAWAVGYDQRFVVGVWLGNLDRRPTDGLTGASGPALLLRAVFAELNRDEETRPLFFSRRLVRQEIGGQRSEWFVPGTEPALVGADCIRDTAPINAAKIAITEEWCRDAPLTDLRMESLLRVGAGCIRDATRIETAAAAPEPIVPIRLRQPVEGLHLAMDPRLAPQDQAFEFRIQVLAAGDSVDWRIDGGPEITTAGGHYLWPLAKGTHRVSARVRRDERLIKQIHETRFLVK